MNQCQENLKMYPEQQFTRAKKTEVINMKNINANLASNNTRQIYARIPGLNIWEYDRGGLQLGIGGRGLSPKPVLQLQYPAKWVMI
jgi:Fe(3+) dicitrate transport protein